MKSNLQKVHAHLMGAIFDLQDLYDSDNIQYKRTAIEIIKHLDMLAMQVKVIEEKL